MTFHDARYINTCNLHKAGGGNGQIFISLGNNYQLVISKFVFNISTKLSQEFYFKYHRNPYPPSQYLMDSKIVFSH